MTKIRSGEFRDYTTFDGTVLVTYCCVLVVVLFSMWVAIEGILYTTSH